MLEGTIAHLLSMENVCELIVLTSSLTSSAFELFFPFGVPGVISGLPDRCGSEFRTRTRWFNILAFIFFIQLSYNFSAWVFDIYFLNLHPMKLESLNTCFQMSRKHLRSVTSSDPTKRVGCSKFLFLPLIFIL